MRYFKDTSGDFAADVYRTLHNGVVMYYDRLTQNGRVVKNEEHLLGIFQWPEATPAEVQTIRDGWNKPAPTPADVLIAALAKVLDRDLTYFRGFVFESIAQAEVEELRKALSAYRAAREGRG